MLFLRPRPARPLPSRPARPYRSAVSSAFPAFLRPYCPIVAPPALRPVPIIRSLFSSSAPAPSLAAPPLLWRSLSLSPLSRSLALGSPPPPPVSRRSLQPPPPPLPRSRSHALSVRNRTRPLRKGRGRAGASSAVATIIVAAAPRRRRAAPIANLSPPPHPPRPGISFRPWTMRPSTRRRPARPKCSLPPLPRPPPPLLPPLSPRLPLPPPLSPLSNTRCFCVSRRRHPHSPRKCSRPQPHAPPHRYTSPPPPPPRAPEGATSAAEWLGGWGADPKSGPRETDRQGRAHGRNLLPQRLRIRSRKQPLRLPPGPKALGIPPRSLPTPRRGATNGPYVYLPRAQACRPRPRSHPKCCPNVPARKIARSVHEAARDKVRAIAKTEAYAVSCRERKKVGMPLPPPEPLPRPPRARPPPPPWGPGRRPPVRPRPKSWGICGAPPPPRANLRHMRRRAPLSPLPPPPAPLPPPPRRGFFNEIRRTSRFHSPFLAFDCAKRPGPRTATGRWRPLAGVRAFARLHYRLT